MRNRILGIAACLALVAGVLLTVHLVTATAASPCQFQKSTSTVAFCDTFDQAAAPNSTRSGPLDPTVWGVSREEVNETDPGSAGVDNLNGSLSIANGQLSDTVNDQGGQSVQAIYPRQPFDVAGREGDVTFDASDNSQGPHGAWPAFVYTDQPVPAPYDVASGIVSSAQNSFGFDLNYVYNPAGSYLPKSCATGGHSVGSVWETVNGIVEGPYTLGGVNPNTSTAFGRWQDLACIDSSASSTDLSHFEVQLGNAGISVWGSNPATTNLIELATCSGCTLPLTRGLVWVEDVHYNGNKFGSQGTDTFGWDNVGFDGPVLPRDLALEVPDRSASQRGWQSGSTVQTMPSTAAELSAASGALVEMDWFATSETDPTISVNGNAPVTAAWDFGSQSVPPGYGPTYVWKTIAIPVPLSELQAGDNSLNVTNAGLGFANVDVILQGAGGVPTCLDPSNCGGSPTAPPSTSPTAPSPSPSPSASPSPSTSPSPSPSASPTLTPTPSPSASPTPETISNAPCTVGGIPGTCTGTFTPDE